MEQISSQKLKEFHRIWRVEGKGKLGAILAGKVTLTDGREGGVKIDIKIVAFKI